MIWNAFYLYTTDPDTGGTGGDDPDDGDPGGDDPDSGNPGGGS